MPVETVILGYFADDGARRDQHTTSTPVLTANAERHLPLLPNDSEALPVTDGDNEA